MENAFFATIGSNYTVENNHKGLIWLSDEPVDLGGNNQGPAPASLLLASLASCQLITMKMYAQRKGWEMEGAKIILDMDESKEGTTIEQEIILYGPLEESQKTRLMEISHKCPVSKILTGKIEITDKVND